MGQITSSVGLISGIDTASIIDQLIALESQPITNLETQNAVLQAEQTAFQTVNAQLLSLSNAAIRLSSDAVFDERTSASSDETVATISAGTGAAVGNFDLSVQQLVSSQQTISRGFLDQDATFIAPEGGELVFNRGEARLDRTTSLANFNGGEGVERGFVRVTDRSGATAVIDLTSVVTVDDVVDQFNFATGVNVVAAIDGDGLRLTDATGQAENDLIVQEVGDGETAASLGLLGSSTVGEIVGTSINTIGPESFVATLNDGNGLRAVSGVDDINITTAGGGSFDVNLSNAVTIQDIADTIGEASGGDVTVTLNAQQNGLRLIDNTGGGPGFAVTAVNDSLAAVDLGLLGADDDGDGEIEGGRVVADINSTLLGQLRGGRGLLAFGGAAFSPLDATTNLADLFQGTGLTTSAGSDIEITLRNDPDTSFGVDVDGLTTVQDLIDAVDTATAGLAALSIDGQSLVLSDTTTGSVSYTHLTLPTIYSV